MMKRGDFADKFDETNSIKKKIIYLYDGYTIWKSMKLFLLLIFVPDIQALKDRFSADFLHLATHNHLV